MSKGTIWKVLIGVTFVIVLIGINIQQNLRLQAFVEPESQAEVNWIAENGLWFGGTYVDSDGDGIVSIDLPVDTTLITIGREMKNGPNVTIISVYERDFREYAGLDCPVIVASDSTPVLNICQLSTLDVDEMIGNEELKIVSGSTDRFNRLVSKDLSDLLVNSSSTRIVSIELLDKDLLEALPLYTGSGQVLGFDSLTMRWRLTLRW